MLYYTAGDVIDLTEARRTLSVEGFKSVREYFQESVATVTP